MLLWRSLPQGQLSAVLTWLYGRRQGAPAKATAAAARIDPLQSLQNEERPKR